MAPKAGGRTSRAGRSDHVNPDLLVLGAGVMGLSVAFEQQQQGQRVAVVDPHAPGAGLARASWAAAGILVMRAGVLGGSPFRRFYLRLIPMFPDWLARIEAASGIRVPYERGGRSEEHTSELQSRENV